MKTTIFLSVMLSLVGSTVCSAKGTDSAKNDDNGKPYVIYKVSQMHSLRLNTMAKAGLDSAKALIASYNKGGEDAYSYYNADKSGKHLIMITTLIGTPVVGLATGVICSLKPIKDQDLNLPDASLATNSAYMKGYRGEAKERRKRILAKNFIAASVIWIGIANICLL